VHTCTCGHAVSALLVKCPTRDTPGCQLCDGNMSCPGRREVSGCVVLHAPMTALWPALMARWATPAERLHHIDSSDQYKAGGAGSTSSAASERDCRGTQAEGSQLLLWRLLCHEKRCLNGLSDFSVTREKTRSKNRSYLAGLGLLPCVAASQNLHQENSSEAAVAASLSSCHPALGLLGFWTGPSSSI